MRRIVTILGLAVWTAASAAMLIWQDTAPYPWLRVAVAVPLVMLVPGHAAMLLIDPERRLGALEWFALSVGASLAATMILGMALAAWLGLTAERMVTALGSLTLLLLIAALLVPAPETVAAGGSTARRAAAAALALVACTAAVLLLSIPRATESGPGTVQLWGLPDAAGGLRIGARNIDATSGRYHLSIQQGGGTITQQEVDMPVGAERIFEVKASATWTKSAPVTAVLTDVSGKLPPRTVSVWPTR